jgi:outer membrane assembly lipoprotein YfiO
VDLFSRGKYVQAIDRFQKVRSEYPFAPEVVSAEMKLAEAYYRNEQYPEAIQVIKDFESMHPTNENLPAMLYLGGVAHLDQFTAVDRDQKTTEIAKGYFERVISGFPNSAYAPKAKEKLARSAEILAEHDFNIASFYLREKKYAAARDRFEEIVRRYRETSIAPKALFQLGESYRLDKNGVKAGLAYQAFLQYYPENPLAKTVKDRLNEVSKEKQDPMTMLLKRDGRPSAAPAVENEPQVAESAKPKDVKLVAKTEVVFEEPGAEKGFFRRMVDTLNPFSESSSSEKKDKEKTDKKDGGGKQVASANAKPAGDGKDGNGKEESGGVFSWMNPFASKKPATKAVAAKDPELAGKVDASLKQRGIQVNGDGKAESNNIDLLPPTPDLSQFKEPPAPPKVDPAVLRGEIDSKLKKTGKEVGDLPPAPEPAPFLKEDGRNLASSNAAAAPPDASAVITNVNDALKRKGIEPVKLEESGKADGSAPQPQEPRREVRKVELAPRLNQERKPLFLDPREFQPQAKPETDDAGQQPLVNTPAPAAAQPSPSPQSIPDAVVKGPAQPPKEKPAAETKVSQQKTAQDEEEQPKGVVDQIKDSFDTLGRALNPFKW